MTGFATVLWFAVFALFDACVDIAQVRATTGGVNLGELALMVFVLYAILGALSGLAVVVMVRLRPAAARPYGATVFALGLVGWVTLLVGGYLNIVHLPSITSPSALAANAGLLIAALLVWLSLSRRAALDRVAASPLVALAAISIAALAGAAIATAGPWRGTHSAEAPVRAGANTPSVFVIVVDTLRFDRTGAGAARSRTPTLDAIGREGAIFRRAYAQSSWTKPSVASLLTSLYPSTHQANLRRDRLSAEPRTMAELFAASGYRTAVFSANPWVSPAFGFERGVQHFYESEHETFARLVILLRILKTTDRVIRTRPVAASLARLEEVFGLRSPRRTNCERDVAIVGELDEWLGRESGPAFAYIHLMSPHIPYDPPPAMDPYRGDRMLSNADQVALLQRTDALEEEPAARLQGLYDATVSHADTVLARLLELLRARGIYDDAVVVVTADHGEEFHEHGRWGHGKSLYDELIHVPLVMRGPGIAVGRTVDDAVMLVDLLPTLAQLIGAPAGDSWEGTSLQRLIAERVAYSELIREGGFQSYMVYRNGRKYMETTRALGEEMQRELYDVAVDPAETRNLASRESEIGDLAGALAQARDRAGAKRVASTAQAEIDERAQERLKALGYTN